MGANGARGVVISSNVVARMESDRLRHPSANMQTYSKRISYDWSGAAPRASTAAPDMSRDRGGRGIQ